MTYGEVILRRLEALCSEEDITLNKLATQSGVTQSTIANLTQGASKNPSIKTLHRLSIGLGMTVSELLDFPEMNETIFDDE